MCTASPPALARRNTFLLPFRYSDWKSVPPVTRWNRPSMYIDPTTGSLVLQFLAAGILSVLAMVSRVREAVKSFFRMLIPRRRR